MDRSPHRKLASPVPNPVVDRSGAPFEHRGFPAGGEVVRPDVAENPLLHLFGPRFETRGTKGKKMPEPISATHWCGV